jgi:hypothetical protein
MYQGVFHLRDHEATKKLSHLGLRINKRWGRARIKHRTWSDTRTRTSPQRDSLAPDIGKRFSYTECTSSLWLEASWRNDTRQKHPVRRPDVPCLCRKNRILNIDPDGITLNLIGHFQCLILPDRPLIMFKVIPSERIWKMRFSQHSLSIA